jgi:ferredoxin
MARLRSAGIKFSALPAPADYRNLREQGYDVVLLAPQMVNAGRRAALVRDCFRGFVDSNAFIRATNRHAVSLPDKMLVLGTGFDSVDTARVALARGCEDVTLLVHATSCESPISSAEIRLMRQEGVKAKHCDFLKIKIERKPDGLQVVFPNAETRVEGKMVLIDGSIMPHTSDEGLTITLGSARPETTAVDVQTMITDAPGVFAMDPIRLANNSITEELAQGERAARIAREFVEGRVAEPALTPVWMDAKPSTFRNSIRGGDMSSTIDEVMPRSAAQEATRCRRCNRSVLIDADKCIGCLRCLETCFTGALYATDESGRPLAHPWRRKPIIKADNNLCEKCGACVSLCPTGAISLNTLVLRQDQCDLPVTGKHIEEESAA